MKCPFCNYEEDKVVDSRTTKEGKAIRRRRECLGCQKRYTTYEYIETIARTVIKKDGTSEPFDSGKLITGIYAACKKRPVSKTQIQDIVEEIESKLSTLNSDEIFTSLIGEHVLSALQKVDEVAYMRFASVCRNFNGVSEFISEIKDLQGASAKPESST